MKNRLNLLFQFMVLLVSVSLFGCYEEPDLISDLVVSKGKVAQVSVVWLGPTRKVAANSAVIAGDTADANSATTFTIEFSSAVPVKEFKVYWAATTAGAQTLVSTVPSGGQKYDAILRSYVITVPIKAQETKGTNRVFFAEIVTDNGLLSIQKSATLMTFK